MGVDPRDVTIVFRPIVQWPGELLASGGRKGTPFQASYTQTLTKLREEAAHLGCREVVVQVAVNEGDIRVDGFLKARSKAAHPGVIVSMQTKHGPIQIATDRFDAQYYDDEGWHHNLRAVALGLEALRKLDRYGITRHGEQYTGWKQLATPMGFNTETMTEEDAARLLAGAVDGITLLDVLTDPAAEKRCYRAASQLVHPDTGEADPEKFKRLQRAHELLTRRQP